MAVGFLVLPFRSTSFVWHAEYCRRGVANYQGTERVAKAASVNIGKANDAGDKRARKKGGNDKRQIWTMIPCSLHWYVVICIFEMMRGSHTVMFCTLSRAKAFGHRKWESFLLYAGSSQQMELSLSCLQSLETSLVFETARFVASAHGMFRESGGTSRCMVENVRVHEPEKWRTGFPSEKPR